METCLSCLGHHCGSLMHTTTMPDDLTTATIAHGLQVHTTKTNIISNATLKRGRGNAVAVQGMNVEILPPERKIKYFGQFITFKNAAQDEFCKHRIKCAWGTIHESQAGVDVTRVPTLRRHSDPIAPQRIRNEDDGRNEQEAPDNATTDEEDDHADNRKNGKSYAAAHAANVELHDPDSEPVDGTTEHNNQDMNEHEESSHDADSNPCFRTVGRLRDETTHKADGLFAANGIKSWIFRQSQIHWRQARMIAKRHDDRRTKLVSNWNPAVSSKQKGDQKQGRLARKTTSTSTCSLTDPTEAATT